MAPARWSLPRRRAPSHADDQPGPGPAGAEHSALARGDHGHVADVADAQPQDRGQDQVGPEEALGHVVRAQHQVGALPPGQAFQDQAERGPGQGGQQAELDPAAASLASASFARAAAAPRTGPAAAERPLEGQVGGLGPDLVFREQAPDDVGGGQPRVRSNWTIDLTYAAVPVTTP